MSKLPKVSNKPSIAVQYILDPRKLEAVPGLRDFYGRVKATIKKMGWSVREFGPDIDPDVISANALECAGRYSALLGVTFTGTSARQTAVLGRFPGPVGVWYFPETPWWSMASAGSGIGYLRDEEEDNPALRVSAIWGDPDSRGTKDQLDCFVSAAHTAFAMKREKIGLVGGCYYDVMPASNWHPDTMTNRLGPSYVEIDMSLLGRAFKQVTDAETASLIREFGKKGMRIAGDAKSLKSIKMSARASLALEKLQEKFGLTGIAVNCYGGPDPEGYTGIMGCCGASGCLKGHALGSVVVGCESDVIQTAQQMIFRHLFGVVPCMADPWKIDLETGVLYAGTCGGPAELARSPKRISIEAGTLMNLYKVGVLGVAFPEIEPADAIVARIAGRRLDKMVVATGRFVKSDSTTIPGRLCLQVELDDPEEFLTWGVIGNHYTFMPTNNLDRDLAKLDALCDVMEIEIDRF
ncbi:MAG TPA: hypothetical protein PLQ76_00765 [bacterium]|nr:hypothetical protein [bacterium]